MTELLRHDKIGTMMKHFSLDTKTLQYTQMEITETFDLASYKEAMEKMALLSPLFSDQEVAYIPYRFVERLYAKCANGKDIAQSNAVFDTKLATGAGIGVKTFGLPNKNTSKFEKIQEFTKIARTTSLNSLPKEEIMNFIVGYRNSSINSDCTKLGINLEISKYHCFIRKPGYGLILEEPYQLIDATALFPCNRNGVSIGQFDESVREFFFSDSKNIYSYSKSKSTLMKKFTTNTEKVLSKFDLPINPDVWSQYYSGISI